MTEQTTPTRFIDLPFDGQYDALFARLPGAPASFRGWVNSFSQAMLPKTAPEIRVIAAMSKWHTTAMRYVHLLERVERAVTSEHEVLLRGGSWETWDSTPGVSSLGTQRAEFHAAGEAAEVAWTAYQEASALTTKISDLIDNMDVALVDNELTTLQESLVELAKLIGRPLV